MTDTPLDPPLEPFDESTPRFAAEVIDLESVRIRFGRTNPRTKKCDHNHLIYNSAERRVWCEDCERTIENFDAFMTFAREFHRMLAEVQRRGREVKEAMNHRLTSRAAKVIDEAWRSRSMAPCCPHCKQALLPEDFAGGVTYSVSAEIERQRRKTKAD